MECTRAQSNHLAEDSQAQQATHLKIAIATTNQWATYDQVQ